MSKFTIAIAILCMFGGRGEEVVDADLEADGRRGGSRGNGNRGGSASSSTICETAQVYGFCVSQSTWSVSYDGGDTFTEMYPGDSTRADSWSSLTDFEIGPITAETLLIVNCTHTGQRMLEDNGLFIANVNCDGEDYYTSEPLSDSLWEVTASTGGDYLPRYISVYCPKVGTAPVEEECLAWDPTDFKGEEINSDAYWVWNAETENTMTFKFDFGDIDVSAAMEQSALFERAHSVVDAMRKENPLSQESLVLLAGAGVLMTIMLVAMFYGYRRPQKDEYQELV